MQFDDGNGIKMLRFNIVNILELQKKWLRCHIREFYTKKNIKNWYKKNGAIAL